MNLSRRSAIKTIGVVSAGSALSGTALAVNEHEDDERDPDDAPDEDEDVGAIRFGHFSPDAPNVDIYVDDDQILADVGYDELSPYLEIAPGTYGVTVTAAGDPETVVYDETIPVDASYYTAVAIGELEGDGADLEGAAAGDEDEGYAADTDDETDDYDDEYEDDPAEDDPVEDDPAEEDDAVADEDETDDPDTGTFEVLLLVDNEPDDVQDETAEIRVVHASPTTPTIDVVDGESGLTVFEDVEFGVPSGYVPVDPGERTLELFPADENGLGNGLEDDADDEVAVDEDDEDDEDEDDLIEPDDPVATADVDLEEGYPYTAFAIGYLDADEFDDEDVDDTDDELEDEMAADDESEDEDDDRSFDVVLATDGTMEADDDELEPEEEELEPETGSEPEDVFETDDDYDDEQDGDYDEEEYETDDEDPAEA